MGAGKTTVARALAKRLSWQAVDLDDEIEAREGRKIASIFEKDGEKHFRDLETQALERVLGRQEVVVATGGGILGREENRQLMQGHMVINLSAPFEVLLERIRHTGSTRPLAKGGEARLKALFEERKPLYEAVETQVDTSQGKLQPVVEQIIDHIKGAMV